MEAIKEKKRTRIKSVQKKPVVEDNLSKPRLELDNAWKDVLQDYFQDFMALCWPEQYDLIDWSKGYKMLDKELSKIVIGAQIKNKIADKLVEVTLKNGQAINVLIHVEVQGQKEIGFEERMFIYYYRIYNRYRKPIASLVILIDGNRQWRPNTFKLSLWSTSIQMNWGVLKLIDMLDKVPELEASSNRFAAVILAQLSVLVERPDNAKLSNSKTRLCKWLLRKGWKRDDILNLLRFIDWVIKLPEELEEKCRKELEIFEEEMKMAYVTSWERHGMQQGMQQGIQQGMQQGIQQGIQQGEGTLLLRLLQVKFKNIPDSYRQKIEQANAETLLLWGERILASEDLEDIFKA
jgi:hypothetical protein